MLVGNRLHHFDEAQNRALAERVARALRPGGVHVIFDEFGGNSPRRAGQAGAALELFFAESGCCRQRHPRLRKQDP